jgi:hypothetical protein
MTYSIADLNEAIENEESDWSGSWGEFLDATQQTSEWREVPEGTEDAVYFKYSKVWQKRFEIEPGVDLPGIGRAAYVEQLQGRDEDVWFIFRVTDVDGEERYFKRQGYYDSYEGLSSYEGDTTEVSPSQQLITVFNSI